RDVEAYVVEGDVDLRRVGLAEEGGGAEAGRPQGSDAVEDVAHREPRVHDVLDDDDVAAPEVGVDPLQLGHRPARHLRGAVGGELVEVHLAVDGDGAHEVG